LRPQKNHIFLENKLKNISTLKQNVDVFFRVRMNVPR
jgi:hypothetical protein